jgi:hypothetical protein
MTIREHVSVRIAAYKGEEGEHTLHFPSLFLPFLDLLAFALLDGLRRGEHPRGMRRTLMSSSMALLTRLACSSSTTPGIGRRDVGIWEGKKKEDVTRREKRIYH